MHDMEAVLIIGAGLAGLAAAEALRRGGIPHRILERETAVGSSWMRRHPQLHLNTHRWLSQLPGLRYPAGTGAFPLRDQVAGYLAAYASELASPIEFGIAVQSITRVGLHWEVQTGRGPHLARHVVVATGRDRVPSVPRWPGLDDYRGEFLHAAHVGDMAGYAGRSVLVIGGGNSAVDVLNHLSRASTGALSLSVRNPPTIAPMWVGGLALHPVTAILCRLPVKAQDVVLRSMHWMFYRDLARAGLPLPTRGGATRLMEEGVVPAVDDGFAQALREGRIRVLPEPAGFDEHSVRFVDGSRCQPDVVIAATGYRPGLEGLLGPLGVLDAEGLPRVRCGRPDPAHPGLWFIGMRPSAAGYFHVTRDAAARIARAIGRDREAG